MTPRHATLAITALALSILYACAQGPFRCAGQDIPIRVVPRDSLGRKDACVVWERARKAAVDAARRGTIPEAALAGWDSVGISPMTKEDTILPPQPTWEIEVFVARFPYDLGITVSRQTDSIGVRLVHKPL